MTRIKDLSRKSSMNDTDVFPVFDGSQASTRSVSFKILRDAVPNLVSAVYTAPNLILTQSDGSQITVDIGEDPDIIGPTVQDNDLLIWDFNTEKLIPAGANKDETTGEITFDQSINVPSGSVNVGGGLQLSEGTSDLVVVNLLKDQMAFSVNSDFEDATGAQAPSYIDFGTAFVLNLQTDDTQVITTNPLTLQLTGTVTPPDTRLIDQIVFRANGPMTNFRASVTDNATGIVLRYVPSKVDFDNGVGFSTVAGDNTFFFASDDADTAGNFHLGFVPFLIENGQVIDFDIRADAIDLLGNVGGVPYLVAEAHDGPPRTLLTGPNTSVNTSLVAWDSTDGGSLASIGNATITDDGTTLEMFLDSPSVTGSSRYSLRDSASSLKFEMEYNEVTDAIEFISTVDMQFGQGPAAGTISFLGNDTEYLFQSGGTNNSFTIDMDASPDTNAPFVLETGGTNGANVRYFVGDRDPEGNINGSPGDMYYRADNLNSNIFIRIGSGLGLTGWQSITGDVVGPALSVKNAVAVFSDTTGKVIEGLDNFQIFDTGATTSITTNNVFNWTQTGGDFELDVNGNVIIHAIGPTEGITLRSGNATTVWESNNPTGNFLRGTTPTGTGTVTVQLATAADALRAEFQYDQNTDQTELTDLSANGLFFFSTPGNYEFSADAGSGSSEIDIISPSATSAANLALKDSSGAVQFLISFDETNDKTNITANHLGDIDITHESDAIRIFATGTAANFLRVQNPDASSFGGFIVDDSGSNVMLHALFDANTDATELFDFSTNGLTISSDVSQVRIDADTGVGIGKDPDTDYVMDIFTQFTGQIVGLRSDKGVTLEGGNKGNGNSTDFFFNRGDVGFNQSEFCIYNNNDGTTTQRNFRQNFTDAGTVGGLNVHYNGTVSVGTLDNVAGAVEAFHVRSQSADTVGIMKVENAEVTNPGTTTKFVGNRDPNGNVTGLGGDQYFRDDGDQSRMYFSKEGGTDWLDVSMNPTTQVEIFSSADLDALATAGTIQVNGSLLLIFKASFTHNVNFNLNNGATLHLSNNLGNETYTFSGTGTLFSGEGSVRFKSWRCAAATTATLFDLLNGVININASVVSDFNMGTAENTAVLIRVSSIFRYGTGFNMIDCRSADLAGMGFTNGTTGEAFMNISGRHHDLAFRMTRTRMTVDDPTSSFLKIDPGMTPGTSFTAAQVIVAGGELFDTTETKSGTFTSVADAAFPSETIVVVSSGTDGRARFEFVAPPTLFVGEKVLISGFVTNTAYNGEHVVFETGAGFFEVSRLNFGTNEAGGSFVNEVVTITDAAHGLVEGEGITVNTDGSTDYDGGFSVHNVTTNTFRINMPFIATATGIWSNASIDQTDPRILTALTPGFSPSHAIATTFVNDNTTANGAIVNNTFTDMVFGTGGSALVVGTAMERWKLIDELNGTFEYTGNEPFDGHITFDFTLVSSGGNVDFRFKWEIDAGVGFVDLADAVEALANVGSDSQSITKTFPLQADKGDQIKPQITRNSGTSGITTSYATIYATQ